MIGVVCNPCFFLLLLLLPYTHNKTPVFDRDNNAHAGSGLELTMLIPQLCVAEGLQ